MTQEALKLALEALENGMKFVWTDPEREAGFVAIDAIKEALAQPDAFEQGRQEGMKQEREACAKVCEPSEEHRREASWGYLGGEEGVNLLDAKAADIRARGNT
jgi:hypothetical protein